MVGMKRQAIKLKKKYELSILAEKGTVSDNGKFNGEKKENNQKHKVTNVRVIVLLVETVKQICK